jgi:hypothetical protein
MILASGSWGVIGRGSMVRTKEEEKRRIMGGGEVWCASGMRGAV